MTSRVEYMPNSIKGPVLEDVEEYLGSIMPAATVVRAVVDTSRPPLLILQTSKHVAAFAFSDGVIQPDYDSLYSGFKSYYSKHERQLVSLDLAFVYCVPEVASNLEEFCSRIETDVYFCRKFVVPLTAPIGQALARLPFLPLTPLNGRALRPPSAQTLLQRSGVPAVLAKYLVVQQERSAEGIVDDCLSKKFTPGIQVAPPSGLPSVDQGTPHAPIHLSAITIKNFRAYRKPQTFALGSDITILYGPNGFGKTSFFDAIDFAVTGGIGRLPATSDEDFEKAAAHLDSEPSQSVVELTFQDSDASHEIVRTVTQRRHALLDGAAKDRKAVLTALTGGRNSQVDRVENFVSLFRATHLFSQEQQELTKDFQQDCRLSAEIVSRMLAFEDYANAVKKSTEVHALFEIAIGDASVRVRQLSDEIEEEKNELARLNPPNEGGPDIDALDAEIESTKQRLADAGIEYSTAGSRLELVRNWRGLLEVRIAQAQSNIDNLATTATKAAELPQINKDLLDFGEQIRGVGDRLKIAEKKRLTIQSNIDRIASALSLADNERRLATDQINAVQKLREVKPRYLEVVAYSKSETEKADGYREYLEQNRRTAETVAGNLRVAEESRRRATAFLELKQLQLSATFDLAERIVQWRSAQTRIRELPQLETKSQDALDSLLDDEELLLAQLRTVEADALVISTSIAEVERSHNELEKLLSQLEGHVTDGTCPLCGDDHVSKENLIERIRSQVAVDAATGLRLALSGLREREKGLLDKLEVNKRGQRELNSAIQSLQAEFSNLTSEVNRFEREAAALELDSVDSELEQGIERKLREVRREVINAKSQIQNAIDAEGAARSGIANAHGLSTALINQIEEALGKANAAKEELERLRGSIQASEVNIDSSESQLNEAVESGRTRLAGAQSSIVEAQASIERERAHLAQLQQEADTLQKQLIDIRTREGSLSQRQTQILALIATAKMPADSSEAEFAEAVTLEVRARVKLSSLLDTASSLEIALDAATTAAAYDRLRLGIRDKQAGIAVAKARRNACRPWEKYFSSVVELVSSEQNRAIDDFTREYGPRSSIIQRRLRSVYGFDNIEISSHESSIAVRVTRRGEGLRPTDYFSQSQQQTLLLGLFLTACSSQNWSAFSPVFLDDPVTHFDDLNTYSLLDLIAGLIEQEFGKRQFIISTCDEKLFQLARQKFHSMNERAKFYRFSSIGQDGPKVTEVI